MRLKYHELAAGLPPLKMTPRGFQSVATSPFLAASRTRARGAGGKRSRQSPRWDGGSAGSESWSVKGLNLGRSFDTAKSAQSELFCLLG